MPTATVDFLVELGPGRSVLDLGGLLMDLQEYLRCKVDVMTPAILKPRVREWALCEAVPLWRERRMRSRALTNETTTFKENSSLYDWDFALWVEAQVAAIRAGDLSALDVENVVEELEGLSKRDVRALGPQLKRVMTHLLKQRYQPERATRSWKGSIRNGRERIADILEQSPSLRRLLPELLTKNYQRAIAQVSDDTRLPTSTFPGQPPFMLDEVLGEEP